MRRAVLALCLVLGWASSPHTGTAASRLPLEITASQLAVQARELGGDAVNDTSYVGAPAIRIPSTTEGTGLVLPGTLPWSEARFLTLDALVEGDHAGRLVVQFVPTGETEPRLSVSFGLFPGLRARLALPLSVLDGQTLELPRTPGRLTGRVSGKALDPRQIHEVRLQLVETASPQTLYIGPVGLVNEEPRFPVKRSVLVDELGQWNAREWEGKTKGDAFLGTYLTFALEDDRDATYPESWCERGGATEATFKATGFFRTHHDKTRWWLVDPEGHGFFSLGMSAVGPGEVAPLVPGTERLFGRLPPRRGPLGQAWTGPSGPEGHPGYSFALSNLVRSFGPEWRGDWTDMTRSRLMAWGFNTVGTGSDPRFQQDAGLPYVVAMPPYPTTPTLLFRDFPDVHAPEFRQAAEAWAQHLVAFKDDKSLVGYFMANEPRWAVGSHNLASKMLESHPDTHSRRALAHWLAERYKGDARDWSVSWGLGLGAFEEVVDTIVPNAAGRSEMARRDLWEFSKEMVRAYVGIPGLACNEVDPNHLNLGMRYAQLSSDLLFEAVGVFDVFSINADEMLPPEDTIAEITARARRPVLIAGFHFGALDRGLPSTGLPAVSTQKARGAAYRRYVETAAANPNLVGTHYSGLNDQPLLGSFDGENYQIGFVDVCHKPYREMVDGATSAHEVIYSLVAGQREVTKKWAREMPGVY